jgi:hypothetical protein
MNAQADTILPVHVVLEFNLYCLPDGGVHVSGFGGENGDALELDPLRVGNAVLANRRFFD